MKTRTLLFICAIVMMVFIFCGCEKPVESNEITLDEMSLTLPDSEWNYGEEENEYVSDSIHITLIKTDDGNYRDDNRGIGFQFIPYEDTIEGFDPSTRFLYIDGYVAEYSSGDGSMDVMIDYNNDYYLIHGQFIDDTAKDTMKELLSSVHFTESGDHPRIGRSYEDINTDVKSEIGAGEKRPVAVQGIVEDVAPATDNEGNLFYIDIGAAYPDSSRISGVIGEKYQQEFEDEAELFDLKGKEVVLWGDCYLYDGVLYVRIKTNSQIIPVDEIEDL